MTNIILILGAPNDDQGTLSTMAKDRLICAYHFIRANSGFEIICTGGFGEHFNRTSKPHSFYAKQFLLERGIQETDFLESPLSINTITDFLTTKDIIQLKKPNILVIVTSDFHMQRVKILYKKHLNYPKVIFLPATSSLTEMELVPLIKHEKEAIQRLNQQ